jgi:hypothetical protein
VISEERAEKALQFLVDSAPELGVVRADRARLEHTRKHILAIIASMHSDKPIGVQEREGYAHEKYTQWLEEYHEAVLQDETLSARIEAAKELIRLFQTQSANLRRV